MDPSNLVIYTTTQTHSLGKKTALILGIKARALPVTPEEHHALRGDTLSQALESDVDVGLHPFILSKGGLVRENMLISCFISRHDGHDILRRGR